MRDWKRRKKMQPSMNHPSVPPPITVATLTEENGRHVAQIGFTSRGVPRYLFIEEETFDITGSDDPEEKPFGCARYDRIGSSVWLTDDDENQERSVLYMRAVTA